MNYQPKTFSQTLGERFGGLWVYRTSEGLWECDDGVRYVKRVGSVYDASGARRLPRARMYFKDGREPRFIEGQ